MNWNFYFAAHLIVYWYLLFVGDKNGTSKASIRSGLREGNSWVLFFFGWNWAYWDPQVRFFYCFWFGIPIKLKNISEFDIFRFLLTLRWLQRARAAEDGVCYFQRSEGAWNRLVVIGNLLNLAVVFFVIFLSNCLGMFSDLL